MERNAELRGLQKMKGGNMASGYRKKVGFGIKPKEINMPTPKMMEKFQQAGTISTIAGPSNAKKFVDIRSRVKKAGGYAMGGEASTSLARSEIVKEQRDRIRKKLLDSINRTQGGEGKPKIIPKKKPRKDSPSIMKRMLKNINRKEILVRAKDKRKK